MASQPPPVPCSQAGVSCTHVDALYIYMYVYIYIIYIFIFIYR